MLEVTYVLQKVVVLVSIAFINYPDKGNLRKVGSVVAHCSRV